jgi:non-ribosomal peptide synthase protein (TIGR01720 family)
VPNLKLLKLGGEALTRDNVAIWADKVKLSNSYGVAECAIRSVFRHDITPDTDFTNCGSAVGCCVWIANLNNFEELTPIGGMGELLIEGPTVARSYLGDPQKTREAFVSPSWLKALFPERKCRVYRTGDLVKYATDGTIRFVGRSDSQVKIHGQRCELREIEHHICVAPDVGLAATAVPSSGPYQGRLVAVVAFHDALTQDSQLTLCTSKSRLELARKLAELYAMLGERVPAYMVPTVWIPVTSLPINPSGKLNRISINRWLGLMSDEDQQFVRALTMDQDPEWSAQSPSSGTEQLLQAIWSRVLNYPVDQIAPGTSFFRIGGDSISAMQVAALCRGEQLQITMQDVMRCRTLHRLAACCDSRRVTEKDTVIKYQEAYNKPFLLGPIQSMFFDLMPEGTNGYDQGFYLRLRERVPVDSIADSLLSVIRRHSMLRARFQKHDGQWTQMFLDPSEAAHGFDAYYLPAKSDIANIINVTRQKLDFRNGPAFVAACIDLGEDGQSLFLTAHHLVVDLVSWRVILRDLEDSIRRGKHTAAASMPYQAWLEQERLHVLEDSRVLEATIPQTQSSYWGLTSEQNVSSDAVERSFSLSEAATTYIFSQTSSESRLDPIDILLGTLAFSFSKVFGDRPPVTIDNEGHGREPWDPSLDLSSTVGWFATRYPVRSDDQARESLVECIRCMRQLRKSAIDNGRQCFAARYYRHSEKDPLRRHALSEMTFNYLGQYQQLETPESLFEDLHGSWSERDSSMRRFALIEMDAVVHQGCFSFTYEYPKTIRYQDRIQQWFALFAQTLETLSATLRASPLEPSLSDFPHLSLSRDEFETLIRTSLPSAGISSARHVEDMYSCSPTQQGIFLSQLRDPQRYNVVAYFRVFPSPGHDSIDLVRMENAWKAVVARHQILRTIILDNMAEHQSLLQVVLAQAPVKTARITAPTESEAFEALELQPPLVNIHDQPLHALSMCAVANEGSVICKLEISHALIDAASNSVLIADLEKAYSGLLVDDSNPAFSSYIARIQETSQEDSLRYWTSYLSGANRCLFPRLTHGASEKVTIDFKVPFSGSAALHDFCTRRDVTTATVYQLAWAMVLKAYTGTESACFGFLASGRDMDIPGIQDSIGPYINMLVCRVDLNLAMSIHETLQCLQQNTVQSLSNQFTSLSEICHALGINDGRLFNTVLSVQRGISNQVHEKANCTISALEMADPTEFDITVNVIDTPTQHEVALTVQLSTIPKSVAQRLAHTLSQTVQDIISQDSPRTVSDIQVLSAVDMSQILSWNATKPAIVDRCVHDLVADQMALRPDELAVSAWDGDFTYAELDTLSSKYASTLISLGVGPETFVPFCMEKTRWSVVGILSIMRAGGACVPLEPSHPRERQQAVIDQLKPPVMVVSSAQMRSCWGLTKEMIVMSDRVAWEAKEVTPKLAEVKPSNAVYVIFTSGSTGVPKGVVWNHSTLASSAVAHGAALKYGERSRMLQFAAHVFDISVSEIITPLVYGKCVVIPSDEVRMNGIEQFITDRKVDWAFLTPTMARWIQADQVPTLKTLVLGGESIGQDNVEKWSQRLQMMIIWGPCETCELAQGSIFLLTVLQCILTSS